MKIEGDVIEFVSASQYYELEASGQKSNTVRLLSKSEFGELAENRRSLKKIRIVHSEHPRVFIVERKLTDISRIGELVGHYLVVFSWRHEEQ